MVDRLGYRDQVYDEMRSRTGDTSQLLFADRWRPRRKLAPPPHRRSHVALVDVRGAIVDRPNKTKSTWSPGWQRHCVSAASCRAR